MIKKETFQTHTILYLIIVLAIVIQPAGAITPGPSTITVDDDGGQDYTTIQQAINNANSGDTIQVYPGTYNENVEVNKQLKVTSTNGATVTHIVASYPGGSAIKLSHDGVKINGFNISGSTNMGIPGIEIVSSNNLLTNNTISNNYNGLWIFSNNNELINNTISENHIGLITYQSFGITIRNSTINNNNGYGIDMSSSENCIFENNSIHGNYAAISFYNTHNSTIKDNTLSENNVGLSIIDSINNTAINNRIFSNSINGIELNKAKESTIYNNYLNNSNNVKFTDNCSGNVWNISKTSGQNIAGGPYLGGNYWLRPNGTGFSQINNTDLNSDGICDEAYTLQSGQVDHLPLATAPESIKVDDDGGQDYTTIQQAINNASNGNIIQVYPGTYNENLNVDKQLILISTNGSTVTNIVASSSWIPTIKLNHDGVTIQGFNISGATGMNNPGIQIFSADNRLIDNMISENDVGVFIESSNNMLINNTISDNNGFGLYIRNSRNHTLQNNLIINHGRHAIYFYNTSNSTIKTNTISENYAGFRLHHSNNNMVMNNNLSSNYYSGLELDDSRGNSIYNNYFNNSNNVKFSNNCSGNVWNTTKTSGQNIIGGPYLGGNYWLEPDGTGFSQINDTDLNGDRICDEAYTIQSGQVDHLPLRIVDTISPASITNLYASAKGLNWINWTWTEPADSDLYHTMVYLNSTFKVNTTNTYYNATGLAENTNYTLRTRTMDNSGNINTTWINDTALTIKSPPQSITGLSVSANGSTWINWTWTNPADAEFNHTMVYLNTTFKANVSGNYYNATGLAENTNYTLRTRTVDTLGNINSTWINDTTSTLNTLPPASITNLSSSTGSSWINWAWTNPTDRDHNYSMVYLNGVFKTNLSGDSYSATNLRSSRSYEISIKTVDTAGNINTTWINDTATTTASSSGGSRSSVGQSLPPQDVVLTYSGVKKVLTGANVDFDLSPGEGPVMGISFQAKSNEGNVVATVQVLKERPSGLMGGPSAHRYQTMSITVGREGTISDDNADNINIQFRVSKEWIRENGIDPASIRLTRYHDETWSDLPTDNMDQDSKFYYFSARTPGFSVFEIVGDEATEQTDQTAQVDTQPATAPEQQTTQQTVPEEEGSGLPGFTAVWGTIMLSLAAVVCRYRK